MKLVLGPLTRTVLFIDQFALDLNTSKLNHMLVIHGPTVNDLMSAQSKIFEISVPLKN